MYGRTGPIASVRPEIFTSLKASDDQGASQKVLKAQEVEGKAQAQALAAPEVKQARYYEWIVNILVEVCFGPSFFFFGG